MCNLLYIASIILIYVPKIYLKIMWQLEIHLYRSRRRSTPVSTILLELDRFFVIDIFFDEEKTFQVAIILRPYPGRGQYILSEWLRNPGKGTLGS